MSSYVHPTEPIDNEEIDIVSFSIIFTKEDGSKIKAKLESPTHLATFKNKKELKEFREGLKALFTSHGETHKVKVIALRDVY